MSMEYINNFTYTVFNKLYSSQNSTGNLAFSGLNLYIFLASINVGLRGTSYSQISNLLGEDFSELYDNDYWRGTQTAKKWNKLKSLAAITSNMRSALFSSCNIDIHFRRMSDFIFGLSLENEKMTAPKHLIYQINKWLLMRIFASTDGIFKKSNTNFYDKSLLTEDKLIFINFFLLTSDWKENFDYRLTEPYMFTDDKGNLILVKMMNQKRYLRVFDSSDHDFRIIFKEYYQGYIYSAIILPRYGQSIQNVLLNFNLNEILNYYEKSRIEYTHLMLPKFKIFDKINLEETLKQLGITDIFTQGLADFGKMTNQTVFVGNLIQVARLIIIDSNEMEPEMTKARVDESLSEPYRFFVDSPFLYFVFSRLSNTVPITAVVTNPNDN
ncbi:Serpin B7 [Thelohanellus kitauei]|uniref:Serpin B7 n=1 Tax=Thelohanellus kitauei TaxID=669202 RepID=A0A0C2M2G4_THEKT|nr:Serpin B7 [Thelohanellus kitauei]